MTETQISIDPGLPKRLYGDEAPSIVAIAARRDSLARRVVPRCDQRVDRESGGCTLTRPGTRKRDAGRGGVTAATLDSKSSAREGVRVQLPPPVPFLDNVPRTLVG